MDSLLGDFWWQGVAWTGTGYPTQANLLNMKLTKYSRWKLGGRLVCDLGHLELTVITGQFCLLCRQV